MMTSKLNSILFLLGVTHHATHVCPYTSSCTLLYPVAIAGQTGGHCWIHIIVYNIGKQQICELCSD